MSIRFKERLGRIKYFIINNKIAVVLKCELLSNDTYPCLKHYTYTLLMGDKTMYATIGLFSISDKKIKVSYWTTVYEHYTNQFKLSGKGLIVI